MKDEEILESSEVIHIENHQRGLINEEIDVMMEENFLIDTSKPQ